MSNELLPLGMRCRKECSYCYQEPVREAANTGDAPYDMAAMKTAMSEQGHTFTLFGGEPLLVPLPDLEELFAFIQREFGASATRYGQSANGIQTDGYLITPEHVRLFKRYDVGVGFSIDGPGELNDARAMRDGGEEATRKATDRSLEALEWLLSSGVPVSVITTLTTHNAAIGRLQRLLEWFEGLHDAGLRHVSIHLLEVDGPQARAIAPSVEENVAALLACRELSLRTEMRFQPLDDMLRLLRGEDRWGHLDDGSYTGAVNCTWNACSPYTTDAVNGVDGQGNRRNCGRTYKAGVQMQKADAHGFERYLGLWHTPQAMGGCQGCRFFYACKGHCPGEGADGDWRAKTEHCPTLMRTFEALEAELTQSGEEPFSITPEARQVERLMLRQWEAGCPASITDSRRALAEGLAAPAVNGNGNVDHGDVPHGDSHGDSDEPAWRDEHPDWSPDPP
jgi:uncharacterized protein